LTRATKFQEEQRNLPRALPWAGMFGPFRAKTNAERFARAHWPIRKSESGGSRVKAPDFGDPGADPNSGEFGYDSDGQHLAGCQHETGAGDWHVDCRALNCGVDIAPE
jgi:hypothetical protein